MNNTLAVAGNLLLADPFMWDINFRRAVLLLCETGDDGAFALIINRPLALTMPHIMPHWQHPTPLYYGGPVGLDRLFILHRCQQPIAGSTHLQNGIYWGGDFVAMQQMIHQQQLSPNDVRFYMGYTGWETTQLATEIAEKTWITLPNVAKYVFAPDSKNLWNCILSQQGGDYKAMAHYPISPQLN